MGNSENSKAVAMEMVRKLEGQAPHCARAMELRVVDYTPGESLTMAFPVKEMYLNPALSMQGGFMAAAFDNVFGPLCLLFTGTPQTTTINMSLNYHRPIMLGDELVITARIKSGGRTTIYMTAEGFNSQGRLVASAGPTYLALNNGGEA